MVQEPDFEKRGGLVVAIAQDAASGEVLMVAYMNRQAWETRWPPAGDLLEHVAQPAVGQGRDLGRSRRQGNPRPIVTQTPCSSSVHQRGMRRANLGYRSCFFRTADDQAGRWSQSGWLIPTRCTGRNSSGDERPQARIPKGSLQDRRSISSARRGWKIGVSERSYFPSVDERKRHSLLHWSARRRWRVT